MFDSDSKSWRPPVRFSGRTFRNSVPVFTIALLAGGLMAGAYGQEALAFEEASVILETNATDCDTGLQFFWDGDPWRLAKVKKPGGTIILKVRAQSTLNPFGLTEQFNETNEPVMTELVDGLPIDTEDCEDGTASPEDTLNGSGGLFARFPAGVYRFDGTDIDGEHVHATATLSHVIPAPPEILGPDEDTPQNPNNTVIRWEKVEELIATVPDVFSPAGITDDDVEIVGFHVVVEREEVGGDPAPLVVFAADLPADATDVKVPPEFLEPDASYKFEVLQIDASGNQTIAEREFETRD